MALFRKRDDDLVRLKTFQSAPSAHSLRLMLEANGIESCLSGEESTAIFGAMGMADSGLVGVQVLVKRCDLADARQVMLEVPGACEALVPAWTCLCGEEVDKGFLVCWSCGHEVAIDGD